MEIKSIESLFIRYRVGYLFLVRFFRQCRVSFSSLLLLLIYREENVAVSSNSILQTHTLVHANTTLIRAGHSCDELTIFWRSKAHH